MGAGTAREAAPVTVIHALPGDTITVRMPTPAECRASGLAAGKPVLCLRHPGEAGEQRFGAPAAIIQAAPSYARAAAGRTEP